MVASDLQSFRQALAELQRQVDELDGLKAGYHEEVLEGEDEVGHPSGHLADAVANSNP
jgi:hypothetical protein